MSPEYVIFLVVGKVLIFFIKKFLSDINNNLVSKWASCDLCSGFWVYFLTALIMKMSILGLEYIPVFTAAIVGSVSSLIMHLLTLGYKAKYEVVVIV